MKKLFSKSFAVFIILSFFCVSCVSKPRFEGNGDLCGLVIDETNKPVKDFVVYCKSADVKLIKISPVITNESGLFVFHNIPSGDYLISGNKNNFMQIKNTKYNFNDRSKIFCIQTKSFKNVLENVYELIYLGERERASALLDSIIVEDKSYESLIIMFYRFFIAKTTEERKQIALELSKAIYIDFEHSDFYRKYAEKLLEEIK